MTLLLANCCCNLGESIVCCNTSVDAAQSLTSFIQCLPTTLQGAENCEANGNTVFVDGMGTYCQGQTCILKTVPLGQIIKHCLNTDICAFVSFDFFSADGAEYLPNWGCGETNNYLKRDGVVYNNQNPILHRGIRWQPIGGTAGFQPVEDQMEVACIPFDNNKGNPSCEGNYFTDLGTKATSPSARPYSDTLKDRITGNMIVETVRGTVAFSFVGDLERVYGNSVYRLYATSNCESMLGGVLYTFTEPSSCAQYGTQCPVRTFRYGVAGQNSPMSGNTTTLMPVDNDHNQMWCKPMMGVNQQSVFLGNISCGYTARTLYVIRTDSGVNNGSGYQDATVTFTGGGGTGMVGEVQSINAGAIGYVVITNQGCGYTSIPICTITSNTGTGATRLVGTSSVTGDPVWGISLEGIGEGFGDSHDGYDYYGCINQEQIYTCLSGGGGNWHTAWAVSASNPISDRQKLIGAPYQHWLGGNQTFILRNPTANVSTTTTCGGIGHTQPVRAVTVEITGSSDWAIGGEALNLPLSTPCDYAYNSLYPTQPAVSGTFEIGTINRDPCSKNRFLITPEFGQAGNSSAFTGTYGNASYTTLKSTISVPVAAAGRYVTVTTYDYQNFGMEGSTPLKKTYYDAFYVYKNPYLNGSAAASNLHLDETQNYAGIAGQSFTVTFLGSDFIGMKKAELRGASASPNTLYTLDNTIMATSTAITNTGINLDPANCKQVTVSFPSTSEHRFMFVYLFNNYIDRAPTSNYIGQGVYVFGVPTSGNTSVLSGAGFGINVAYNLDPNQSVYMGGTVQPFKRISYNRAPNETASIVVDGVTILDNPNNDLPNASLGAGFGAALPSQLMGTVGTQSVVFTTRGGSVTLSRRQAITPKITAVSVSIFPKSGGTTLTLTGLNLDLLSVFYLFFSSQLKSTCSIVSQSATSVVLTTGALTPTYSYSDPLTATYLLDLKATYAAEPLLTWQSSTNYLGGFTFTMVSAPTITSVTPSSTLAIAGGTSVVIIGKHYVHIVSVTFKGVAVTPTINSELKLTCIAPANSAGSGQLVITTLGGSVSFSITYV